MPRKNSNAMVIGKRVSTRKPHTERAVERKSVNLTELWEQNRKRQSRGW